VHKNIRTGHTSPAIAVDSPAIVHTMASQIHVFTLMLAAVLPLYATAPQAQQGPRWAAGVHFENDLFADTDQQYTNGIKLTLVSPDLTSAFRDRSELPDWARKVIPWIPFIREKGAERNLAFSIGQNIYTPQDTETSAPVLDDRPYAGWLYFATTFQTRDRQRQDTVDVQFGLIGPYSFAEQSQELVHRLRGIAVPKGWNNQLRTEPGIVLAYERVLRVMATGEPHGLGTDLLPRFGGAVGNIATYANVGVQWRVGWNLPPDFGYSIIRPGDVTQVNALRDSVAGNAGDAGTPPQARPRGFSFYLFAGADGRLVARDIFLDGNTFRDSQSVDSKPFVADLMAGATLGYGDFKLSIANVLRTREFNGQPGDHRFGSLTISYAF
jgi:hypothetical protein